MLQVRLGSYSIPTTLALIPSFPRLKSITRYFLRWPPPLRLLVTRPLLLRPPDLEIDTSKLFSGSNLVISSNPEIVRKRVPGDLGFERRETELELQRLLLQPLLDFQHALLGVLGPPLRGLGNRLEKGTAMQKADKKKN